MYLCPENTLAVDSEYWRCTICTLVTFVTHGILPSQTVRCLGRAIKIMERQIVIQSIADAPVG